MKFLALPCALLLTGVSLSTAEQTPVAQEKVSYQAVQRILDTYCVGCHTGDSAKGNIRLTSYEELMDSEVIVPKSASKSRLYKAVTGAKGVRKMPPGRGVSLNKSQLGKIENWIAQGAKDDE